MTNEDQHTMLMAKSLLNHLSYFIRDEDKKHVDAFHTLCRKYCSWGHSDCAKLSKVSKRKVK